MDPDYGLNEPTPRHMPAQKPGRSKQDYATPPEFIEAVLDRLNVEGFTLDIAASADNAKADVFYTEEQDAFKQEEWGNGGWAWLNPPYAHIAPWVKRAYEESQLGAYIAVLIPAGVGANWWRDWVHDKAHVLFINGRLSFNGIAPYPKDCALLLYTPHTRGGYEVWDWRTK